MPNHNIGLLKGSYRKLTAHEEGLLTCDYNLQFPEDPSLVWLVQSAQIPPVGREPIEGWGTFHVKFTQPGPYVHYADLPISFLEVISGASYNVLRTWVKEKTLQTVTLQMQGEYGNGPMWVLEKSWLELEGVDLSVDEAAWVKPSGTLHANWINPV